MDSINTIFDMWKSAGWFALALWILSVVSWYYLYKLYRKVQESNLSAYKINHQITHKILAGDSRDKLLSWLQKQKGIASRLIPYVLMGDMTKVAIKARYEEACLTEINHINKDFGVVMSLVKSAPLLGLLGTVAGMIQTFASLSISGDINSISKGISKALLTTQLGLMIALPGVFAYAYLKRKFSAILIELERMTYHILKMKDLK